jgi:hypothetical protein
MKRSEFVERLAIYLKSFPDGCSDYHICDMLLYKMEKDGMTYITLKDDGITLDYGWEPENIDPDILD